MLFELVHVTLSRCHAVHFALYLMRPAWVFPTVKCILINMTSTFEPESLVLQYPCFAGKLLCPDQQKVLQLGVTRSKQQSFRCITSPYGL